MDRFEKQVLHMERILLPGLLFTQHEMITSMAIHTARTSLYPHASSDLIDFSFDGSLNLQLKAIHESKQSATQGKLNLPKTIQFGRLRKKSEFSRMQALFGHYFRNTLLPKALSVMENNITARETHAWVPLKLSSLACSLAYHSRDTWLSTFYYFKDLVSSQMNVEPISGTWVHKSHTCCLFIAWQRANHTKRRKTSKLLTSCHHLLDSHNSQSKTHSRNEYLISKANIHFLNTFEQLLRWS